MSTLSNLLNKEIILTPENEHDIILLRINKENVEINDNIDPKTWKVSTR